MSIDLIIDKLLLNLANGTEPSTGMLFFNQISAINFNYDMASLEQIDNLLTKIAKKADTDSRYRTTELLRRDGGNMLFLSLAIYAGNYIAKKLHKVSNTKTMWHGDADLPTRLQNNAENYEKQAPTLVFMVGNTPYFPLKAIFEALAHTNHTDGFITHFVTNALKENGYVIDNNQAHKVETKPMFLTTNTSALTTKTLETLASDITITKNTDTEANNTLHSKNNLSNARYTHEKTRISPELLMQLQTQKSDLKERNSYLDNKMRRLLLVTIVSVLIMLLLVWFR